MWRPYTDKGKPFDPHMIEVHWFRPALDSSGERPQLPTSVVPYRVSTRGTYYTFNRWGTPTRPTGLTRNPRIYARFAAELDIQNLARDILPPPIHARPRACPSFLE